MTPPMKPNPYLPGSGITDKEGRDYVFHNPALAIRKLSEYAQRQGLYRFHLSSLKPLNPANSPTPFEAEALKEFEWRGLGLVPYSALRIRKEYAAWDAEVRFQLRYTLKVPLCGIEPQSPIS